MDHIFIADTNLFFECKRLEDLPWAELGVDPVVIALTKPVLGEIDKHKKSGGRTRKRAVEISARVRAMLEGGRNEEVIREAGPRVVLRLSTIVKPDPALEQALDYAQNDDRIVGIVAAMAKEAGSSVTFLSDDGVASSTAHGLGLPFRLIPASWKRPPEETTEAKTIRDLQKDLATYRAQEPRMELRGAPDSGDGTIVRRVPQALARSDIDRLMGDLETRHPLQKSFDPPPPETKEDGTAVSYEAPDADAIKEYATTAYPNWLAQCRSVLDTLHERRVEAEPALTLTFGLKNAGTRPASRLRVSFEARGNIWLRRANDDEDAEDNSEAPPSAPAARSMPRLPAPPRAPAFRRIVKSPPAPVRFDVAALKVPTAGLRIADLAGVSSALDSMKGMGAMMAGIERLRMPSLAPGFAETMDEVMRRTQEHERLFGSALRLHEPHMLIPEPRIDMCNLVPPRHDDEAFYFDEWPPGVPLKRGALTCDLFRHQDREELFALEVVFPRDGDVSGAIVCTVQAENLTEPVTRLVPVSRTIETVDLTAAAERLLAECQ